ncbi:MAG TPA: hypothetical protein VGW78_03640 [Candidatus Babeliales bacterium]|jgi:hypothetical protein|nr:hypothetical protein [Candidatus Babeliales bacterium]
MNKYIALLYLCANSLLMAHDSIDQLPVIDPCSIDNEYQCEQDQNHPDNQIHQYFENFFHTIIRDNNSKASLFHIIFQILHFLNSKIIRKRMPIEKQLNWYRCLVQYIIMTFEVNIAESQYIYNGGSDENASASIGKLIEKRLSDMQTKVINNEELLFDENFEILDLLSSETAQKELSIQEHVEYNGLLVQSIIQALSQNKNV